MSVIKKMKKLFRKFGALSDFQLEILMGISGNTIRPCRGAIEKTGFIKKTINKIKNKNRTSHSVYQCTNFKKN